MFLQANCQVNTIAKHPALAAFYERLLRKHGKAKARVAVAAKLLKAVYRVLKRDEDYRFNSLSTAHLGKPGKVLGHQWASEALR
jgi:hypothetical protein